MVIKDGLSRVFFHFKPPKLRASSSSKNGSANGQANGSSSATSAAQRQRLLQKRLRKMDHVNLAALRYGDFS